MTKDFLPRALSALILLPIALVAQVSRSAELATLRNWTAPLFWQPSQREAMDAPQATAPPGALVFVAMTPCRVVDTRSGSGFTGAFGPPSLSGGVDRTFPLQSSTTCPIPAIAQAYSLNVTVAPPRRLTSLTVWPTGQPQPNTVTIDDPSGTMLANAAIVAAGSSGSVDAFPSDITDLIIDINGYYAPPTGLTLAQGTAGAPSLSFSGDTGTGIFSSGTAAIDLATAGTSRLTVRSDGDLEIPGSIRKNGQLFVHSLGNFGSGNTAVGASALPLAGSNNAAENAAFGNFALFSNTSGTNNSGIGIAALASNTTGSENTAVGSAALNRNTTGNQNTAVGALALEFNTGASNTAVGYAGLANNGTGSNNTALGTQALGTNTTGTSNTAVGYLAAYVNSSGFNNTAVGYEALQRNATGGANTAIGFQALFNTSGVNNIGIGDGGGVNVGNGSSNIEIGNIGTSTDSNTIRIGTVGNQTAFFAAGIRGATAGAGALTVLIDSNGRMGTASSSRRFKEDIQDMGDQSGGLLRLRPVTFRYKEPYSDGSKPLDYGLIAEEVDEVYPGLVARSTDGQVESVQYQKLVPMLLNELQKQNRENRQLETRLAALEAMLSEVRAAAIK